VEIEDITSSSCANTQDTDGFAVTVLGVGNPIMGDDGVGIELLARVQDVCPDPRIEFVDGGTAGLELLHVVQDSERILLLDAIAGDTPGKVVEVDGDQIPRLMAAKLSPHQVGLVDIFSAARLLGYEPREVVAVGVVPEFVDTKYGLTPVVEEALDEATKQAVSILERWLAELPE
jgi:hydrogenase maturation protease